MSQVFAKGHTAGGREGTNTVGEKRRGHVLERGHVNGDELVFSLHRHFPHFKISTLAAAVPAQMHTLLLNGQ